MATMASRTLSVAATCALATLLGSCATVNPYYDARQPHHRPEGFQNRHDEFTPRGLFDLVRWRVDATTEGLPPPPAMPTPQVPPDLAFISANAVAGAAMVPAVTWIGHSTVLAQFGGLNLLTDPMFSERASPLSWAGPRRAQPPGLAMVDLPRIDVVLVSHDHYDHLDEASVRTLEAQPGGAPLFVAPLGVGRWLREQGMTRVIELDWWQSHRLGDVEIVLTPAQHWSGRTLTDRLLRLWGGFAVFAPDFHLFYSGDTGYSRDFADIGERFADRNGSAGFDLSLIPIGAYEPRWFMAEQHVNPAEALRIHRDVRSRRSLGVHWGTFELTDEALDAPPLALAAARRAQGLPDDSFFTLAVGETRKLPRRPPEMTRADGTTSAR